MNTKFKSSSNFTSDVNNMGANYLRFRLDNDTGRYIEVDQEVGQDFITLHLRAAKGNIIDSATINIPGDVRVISLELTDNILIITNSDGEKINCDISELINIIDGKVTQVSGKGLSTHDFDNDYKQKLENLENFDDSDLKQAIITLDETKLDGIKVNEQSIQDADIKTDQESIVFENNKLKLPNEWINYLKEQTFQQPSIDTFILCDINNNALPATYEAGASVKVEKIKHREINIQNISENSLMINGQIVPLSDDIAVFDINDVDVTSTTTFTIIGSYIRPSGNSINISKNATITFNRYVYSNVIDSDIIPTTGIKQATINVFATNGADFSYNVGDYIYLFTTSAGKTVQTNVLGQWIDVDAENLGEVAFTQDNDVTYNYYAYRIGPFIASGTAKYRV